MATTVVGILSDHVLFAQGLRTLLADQASLAPVVVESLHALRSAGTAAPEVVLLDAEYPDALGLCLTVARDLPSCASVMVAAAGDDHWALQALRAGARGVLARDASRDQLVRAIEAVREGQVWAPRDVLKRALQLLSDLGDRGGSGLSGREQDVLRHTLAGLSNREIASRLGISPATVKAHLTSIFRKLDVRDRTQLVVLCSRRAMSGPRPASQPPSPTLV